MPVAFFVAFVYCHSCYIPVILIGRNERAVIVTHILLGSPKDQQHGGLMCNKALSSLQNMSARFYILSCSQANKVTLFVTLFDLTWCYVYTALTCCLLVTCLLAYSPCIYLLEKHISVSGSFCHPFQTVIASALLIKFRH